MEDNELTQWEYKELVPRDQNEKNINELGKKGWEAVATEASGTLLFKKKKEKKETTYECVR